MIMATHRTHGSVRDGFSRCCGHSRIKVKTQAKKSVRLFLPVCNSIDEPANPRGRGGVVFCIERVDVATEEQVWLVSELF